MVNRPKYRFNRLCTGLIILSCSYYQTKAGELVDPTAPLNSVSAAPAETKKSWQLQGIYRYDTYWVAIINGKQVREGDMINGGRVTEIGQNRVSVKHGDESIDLTMRTVLLTPSDGRK